MIPWNWAFIIGLLIGYFLGRGAGMYYHRKQRCLAAKEIRELTEWIKAGPGGGQ